MKPGDLVIPRWGQTHVFGGSDGPNLQDRRFLRYNETCIVAAPPTRTFVEVISPTLGRCWVAHESMKVVAS